MSKIFIGNITAEAERLVTKYLNKYMPDAVIEPLKAAGIKGKIKNHARRPDVVLVILDESLYDMCVGVADDVLSLPKVHKYVSDSGLLDFLVGKFGVLEGIPAFKSEVEEPIVVSTKVDEVVEDEFESLTVSDAEDTSNDTDKDSIIQKLNDEIIIRDTMIRNLEAQIEEKSESESVSHFVNRIKSLEAELDSVKDELNKAQNDSYLDLGKITRAEQVITSVDILKEELRIEKDKCLSLESSKTELETRVSEQKEEVNKLRLSVVEMTDKVKDYKDIKFKFEKLDEDLKRLQSDITSKDLELETLRAENSELESSIVKLNGEVAEIGVLTEKVNSLEQENKVLLSDSSELVNLKVEIENLRVDCTKFESDKSELENKLSSLTLDLNESKKYADSVILDKEKLERDLASVKSDSELLAEQLNKLGKKLSDRDDEIEKLRSGLSDSSELSFELELAGIEVTDLKQNVSELTLQLKQFEDTKASLSDKISEVEDLQSKLKEKSSLEDELKAKTEELIALQSELDSKIDELNAIKDERTSQSSVVSEKEEEIVSKQSTIDKLQLQVNDLTNIINELKSINSNLDTSNKKLTNEVEALRIKTEETVNIIESSNELEKELTEHKRKIARVESENESLKEELEKSRGTKNKDVEISKLRSEISDYKTKLRQAQDSSLEQNKNVTDEITQLRERCAEIELTLIDKDAKLKSSEDSIFSKMGTIASPKTVFNLSLDVPSELPNMYVVASGSSESNLITYQTLRRFCASCNKSVLILDLVTDSYIDREFGVEKILSPIEFLQGTKPIKDFISQTKISPSTYISSTASNYINTLYLLSVDWTSVLTNLVGLTDIVIINVGCLNEVVSKVLFNSFSTVMNSHIIIKASPINLRTALLTLTGISSAKKSKISCVNFENSSKAMYQRLAQKFNTQILKDSDVLKL